MFILTFGPIVPQQGSKGHLQEHAGTCTLKVPIVHSLSGEKCTMWTTTMTASKPARICVSPFTDPPRMLITAQEGREGGRK